MPPSKVSNRTFMASYNVASESHLFLSHRLELLPSTSFPKFSPLFLPTPSQPHWQAHFLQLIPLNVVPQDAFLGSLLLSLAILFASGSFSSYSPNYHLEIDDSQALAPNPLI